jgi:tetratricopeptide (TPR) repeat protein
MENFNDNIYIKTFYEIFEKNDDKNIHINIHNETIMSVIKNYNDNNHIKKYINDNIDKLTDCFTNFCKHTKYISFYKSLLLVIYIIEKSIRNNTNNEYTSIYTTIDDINDIYNNLKSYDKNISYKKNNKKFNNLKKFWINYLLGIIYEEDILQTDNNLMKAIKHYKVSNKYNVNNISSNDITKNIPNIIGLLYDKQQKYKKAKKWFKRGVNKNDKEAYYNLGDMYIHCEYIHKNENKGLKYMNKSAKLGDEDALEYLHNNSSN